MKFPAPCAQSPASLHFPIHAWQTDTCIGNWHYDHYKHANIILVST